MLGRCIETTGGCNDCRFLVRRRRFHHPRGVFHLNTTTFHGYYPSLTDRPKRCFADWTHITRALLLFAGRACLEVGAGVQGVARQAVCLLKFDQ